MMKNYDTHIIALVGLPSSGKSTLVNSLAKKRILQTGLARTTLKPTLIGETNVLNAENFIKIKLVSDDDIEYQILDLPGIADAEDIAKVGSTSFDEIAQAWITKCDLILWCSSADSAFLTKHEKTEFDKYKNLLDKLGKETCTVYDIAIVLTKSDIKNTSDVIQIDSDNDDSDDVDEIINSEEETGLKDSIARVENMFRDTKIPILHYNAHGRVLHGKKQSVELKKLVNKINPGASTANIDWNLAQFFGNGIWYDKQIEMHKKSITEWFASYINYCNITHFVIVPSCTVCKTVTFYDNIKCDKCFGIEYYFKFFAHIFDKIMNDPLLLNWFFDFLTKKISLYVDERKIVTILSFIAIHCNTKKIDDNIIINFWKIILGTNKNLDSFYHYIIPVLFEDIRFPEIRVWKYIVSVYGDEKNYIQYPAIDWKNKCMVNNKIYQPLKYKGTFKERKTIQITYDTYYQSLKFAKIDEEFCKNPTLCADIEFIKKVKELRKKLYPEMDDKTDIQGIFTLVINDILPSLFFPISTQK